MERISALTTRRDLTGEGKLLGTLPYMSPEQLEGKRVDARSDIFSFGAVLYEMATGKRPFKGESQASLIAAILDRDPVPMSTLQPMTPLALDRVVRKCLAKDSEHRWQSARDLTDDVSGEDREAHVMPRTAKVTFWCMFDLSLLFYYR